MFNLCLFSSYVMPGEQRTRSWLTSLYNKDTVIDSFVETNDKIPGEAPTLISENIQSLFYCSVKLTFRKFWMGRVYTCCTMYIYMYGVDTKIWMAFFEILLYRTCTCKRKLFALWDCWSWVWVLLIGRPFDGCDFIHVLLAMLPLVVKDLLYTVHVHIHAHVKLSWSLSNCVIHIPLKALVSVTYTCISTIYCILGNVPPFYFHPLCPRCHQQIYLSLSQLCPGEFKMGQNCLQV